MKPFSINMLHIIWPTPEVFLFATPPFRNTFSRNLVYIIWILNYEWHAVLKHSGMRHKAFNGRLMAVYPLIWTKGLANMKFRHDIFIVKPLPVDSLFWSG